MHLTGELGELRQHGVAAGGAWIGGAKADDGAIGSAAAEGVPQRAQLDRGRRAVSTAPSSSYQNRVSFGAPSRRSSATLMRVASVGVERRVDGARGAVQVGGSIGHDFSGLALRREIGDVDVDGAICPGGRCGAALVGAGPPRERGRASE